MISAKLIGYTQPSIHVGASTPEELISYAARVSNPSNQNNYETAEGLLKYCIRNKHFSIFEMVNAVVQIKAPRDITRQMLRHRSFSFQEFSQRYSDEIQFCDREVRMQDKTNRQNSEECTDVGLIQEWNDLLEGSVAEVKAEYLNMRKAGVAKEVARVLLPEGLTLSTLYANGTLRSWMHYLEVREDISTQKEHRMLANKIREALEPVFPTVLGITKDV
jgi:thymidylate synthase (FAD)